MRRLIGFVLDHFWLCFAVIILVWAAYAAVTTPSTGEIPDTNECGEYCADFYEPPEYVPGEGGW